MVPIKFKEPTHYQYLSLYTVKAVLRCNQYTKHGLINFSSIIRQNATPCILPIAIIVCVSVCPCVCVCRICGPRGGGERFEIETSFF